MAEEQETFEGWAPVVGFEGIYEVSDHGRVRRIGKGAIHGKGHGGGPRIGRVLRPQMAHGGYEIVQLWRDGKPKMCLVHRLVAAAFLGPGPVGTEVNHRNGDKHNNRPANLEYVTHSENNLHAYRTGLHIPRIDQLVAARRKLRVTVPCACGCGAVIETPDHKGRDRRYISGHNMMRRSA